MVVISSSEVRTLAVQARGDDAFVERVRNKSTEKIRDPAGIRTQDLLNTRPWAGSPAAAIFHFYSDNDSVVCLRSWHSF